MKTNSAHLLIDNSVPDEQFKPELVILNNVFYTEKRYKSYWGSYQFTKANINILRECSARFPTFDYIVMLSGQDYPLTDNPTLESFWRENKSKNYVIHMPIKDPNLTQHMERYENYYFFPKNRITLRYPSANASFMGKLKDAIFKASGLFPLPKFAPLPLYFGSNWFRLNRRSASAILRHFDNNLSIEKYFKHALLAEEVMVQSILINIPVNERDPVINDDLTYTYWDEPLGRYPNPLVEGLFDRIMDSGHLFARKFDHPISESLLLKIDLMTS